METDGRHCGSAAGLHIGIDARVLSGKLTGIGRYISELMRQLDVLMPDSQFYLYGRGPLSIPLPSSRWHVRTDRGWGAKLPGGFWSRLRLHALSRRDPLNVFWAAITLLPWRARVPVVTTIYDLNHVIVPGSMALTNRLAHSLWFGTSVRNAASRVAISQGTADRTRDIYGVVCEAVARPAAPADFVQALASGARGQPRERPYLLSVGTHEPRKNLAALIEAVGMLKLRGEIPHHDLVLVGGKGWGDKLPPHIRDLASEPWCVSTGFVSDASLVQWYAGADAFVFPSIYEGFGIPLVEARACGTRIIATDLPELREAGGGNAIYTGTSPSDIADAILRSLATPHPGRDPDALEEGWAASAEALAEQLWASASITR